jgi:integrase
MASITKHKSGWRAQVARRGVRKSKVFATKQEAKDWAARTEREIVDGERIAGRMKLTDALDRYAREVSPRKRGERWEVIRLAALGRDMIGAIPMGDLTAQDMANWRDRRLRQVGPGSVRREMALLGGVFRVARDEWGAIARSPLQGVRKPPQPPARERLPTPDEIERLRHVAGEDLTKTTARAFYAFLFSGETAMRAGEIVGLSWARIDLAARTARLPMTKNGTAREVPLSSAAVAMLEALPRRDPVFGLTSPQLDALWRKIRDKAGVEGLTFHDARAWALTRLARKVDVLTLAKISGHRDISLLSNVYYRETASSIAKRLG